MGAIVLTEMRYTLPQYSEEGERILKQMLYYMYTELMYMFCVAPDSSLN